jgi:hypothetical protein
VSDILIPYALKDGAPIHVSEVDSGLACNCICPSCHERLVAKKGGNRVNHFAHHSGESCSSALESSLHIAAKDILAKEKRITLPAVHIQFKSDGPSLQRAGPRIYRVDSVCKEKKIGNIKPDLILTIDQRELIVEIFVTHKVDSQKIHKITELDMSAIEIDLRALPRDMTKEALTELIVDGVDNKRWLNNERVNYERKELMAKTVRKEVIRPSWMSYRKVEKCPKIMRKENWNNGRHPNFDCMWCEYCLDIEPNTSNFKEMTHIHCIGHALVLRTSDNCYILQVSNTFKTCDTNKSVLLEP